MPVSVEAAALREATAVAVVAEAPAVETTVDNCRRVGVLHNRWRACAPAVVVHSLGPQPRAESCRKSSAAMRKISPPSHLMTDDGGYGV